MTGEVSVFSLWSEHTHIDSLFSFRDRCEMKKIKIKCGNNRTPRPTRTHVCKHETHKSVGTTDCWLTIL